MSKKEIPRVLGIDPGETNGLAYFVDGEMEEYTNAKGLDELIKLCEHFANNDMVDVVVVEEYRIRPQNMKAHNWSKVPTIEMIGAIKTLFYGKAKIVTSPPFNKPMGYKWMGLNPPKNKELSHHFDAAAHAYHYLVSNKYTEPMFIKRKKA